MSIFNCVNPVRHHCQPPTTHFDNTPSPFPDKATSEFNTTDQWGLILEICDRVGASTVNSKECLRSVMRRLAHTDPHVVIQAITLLDACVSNCGKTFHLEVASREFENEFRRLMAKQQPQVAQKMAGLVKKWAEEEFKSDPQLNLIPSLYAKLKAEGVDFAEMDSKVNNDFFYFHPKTKAHFDYN